MEGKQIVVPYVNNSNKKKKKYEYVDMVENVLAQAHSRGHSVNKWENDVNICRAVLTIPAIPVDQDHLSFVKVRFQDSAS